MNRKIKKYLSCFVACTIFFSSISLTNNIFASEFTDETEIYTDEDAYAEEILNSEEKNEDFADRDNVELFDDESNNIAELFESEEDLLAVGSTDLPSGIYAAQQGSTTCTLASAAMMLRARFYKSNSNKWSSITEAGIRSTAWIEGSGLRHSWTYKINNDSVSVNHSTTSGISSSSLKALLNNHSEGIVLYCGKLPHAVFLTDYDGDTFYCADPIQSYSGKRIALSSSYLGKKYGSQASVLSNVTAYWYVSSYTIEKSEPENPYYNSYGFDNPANNEVISDGTFLFQGWIDAKKEISSITCSINHGARYVGTDLYTRPDVSYATAFRTEIDSNILNLGTNDIALCVNFTDGSATVVENRTVTWSPKLLWGYDSPTEDMQITDNQFQFSGWIETGKKLESVSCSLNHGEQYLTANLYKRPDVPSATAFRLDIGASNLHYGENYIAVCTHYEDGTGETIAEHKVRKCIDDAIEYPQNNENFTCKNAWFLLQGWSTDDTRQIDHFEFIINDTRYTTVAHTRADLAGNARYYREQVPIDRLKNGKNKIEIFAYYSDGTSRNIGQREVIGDIEHTWDSGKVTQEASCIKTGIRTYTCTTCQSTKTEEIPATGKHENTEVRNVKEATCAEEGYTGDTYCKDCGTKLSTGEKIAKKAHIWDSGRVTQEATCTKTGTKTYICTTCQSTRTEEIPATGHVNKITKFAKKATCKSEGYTGDIYCKDCGELLEEGDILPKEEHVWDEGKITQQPGCTKSGERTYTCTTCQTTKTEEIPATGKHENTEVRNVKEATCAEEGYTGDTYCKDCGMKLSTGEKIAKKAHIWDSGKVTQKATCTKTGIRTYTCTTCQTAKTEEIPATGHVNKITKFAKEATCKSEGYTGDIYCKDCGKLLEEGDILPKEEHVWDEGKITQQPGCVKSGERTYTCTTCQTTKTEEIPATGHLNKVTKFAKKATCKTEGYTGDIYCQDCGELLEEGNALPQEAHIWDEGKITKQPTSSAAGVRTYTCKDCGTTKTESIAKLQPKKLTPGKVIKDKATNGVYKVLKDGVTVEFARTVSRKTSVKIPDTVKLSGITCKVTEISANAFKNDTTLRTVTIGKNVTIIGSNAFYGARKLSKVSGGSAISKIGDKAFYNCSGLTGIELSKTVKYIGRQAFYNCKNLKTIIVKTSQLTSKNVGTKAFTGIYTKPIVKVPANKFKAYQKLLKSKGMSTKAIYKK